MTDPGPSSRAAAWRNLFPDHHDPGTKSFGLPKDRRRYPPCAGKLFEGFQIARIKRQIKRKRPREILAKDAIDEHLADFTLAHKGHLGGDENVALLFREGAQKLEQGAAGTGLVHIEIKEIEGVDKYDFFHITRFGIGPFEVLRGLVENLQGAGFGE